MSEHPEGPPSLESARRLMHEGAFEETLAVLEAVVEHLERGRLSIDESILWYETGLGLSRRCTNLLEQAELRIRTLEEGFLGSETNGDTVDDEGR